jgi:SAM-dependent methyltransferase
MDEPRRQHNVLQSKYFDELADYFLEQNIPQAVQQRQRQIVQASKVGSPSCVLDVGTGVGVLIEHFLKMGVLQQNIVGCDLSAKMLVKARERYPGVYFYCGDILDLGAGFSARRTADWPVSVPNFDAVFFNGCFGNIWDQRQAIDVSVALLAQGGRIVISHPLGRQFVASLHKNEPEIVPHPLPNREQLEAFADDFDLCLELFQDEPNFYLAVLKKWDSTVG